MQPTPMPASRLAPPPGEPRLSPMKSSEPLREANPSWCEPLTPPPSASEPPLPAAALKVPKWEALEKATGGEVVANSLALTAMTTILQRSLPGLSMYDVKVALDGHMKAAGNPTDPVERMLLQQLFAANQYVLQMNVLAVRAQNVEQLKVYNTLLVRLQGEFRRTALALRQYRSPVSGRSFSVVHQQNVTSGSQDIRYNHLSLAEEEQKNSSRRNELGDRSQPEFEDDTIELP